MNWLQKLLRPNKKENCCKVVIKEEKSTPQECCSGK